MLLSKIGEEILGHPKYTKDQLTRDDYEEAVDQLVGQIPQYIQGDLIEAMKRNYMPHPFKSLDMIIKL